MLDPGCHSYGIARIPDLLDENCKFVSAKSRQGLASNRQLNILRAFSRNRVVLPQRASQTLRNFDQDFVTGGMAKAVIELLEIVDIHKKDRKLVFWVSPGTVECARQPLQKKCAVGQVGQIVMKCIMPKL